VIVPDSAASSARRDGLDLHGGLGRAGRRSEPAVDVVGLPDSGFACHLRRAVGGQRVQVPEPRQGREARNSQYDDTESDEGEPALSVEPSPLELDFTRGERHIRLG
jgi:hypothetical protein